MKRLIIVMALLAIIGCTHIDVIDDPIIKATGIPGDTVSYLEEVYNWLILFWPSRGF